MKPYLHSHEAVAAHGFPSLAHLLARSLELGRTFKLTCLRMDPHVRACVQAACVRNRQGFIGYFIGQPSECAVSALEQIGPVSERSDGGGLEVEDGVLELVFLQIDRCLVPVDVENLTKIHGMPVRRTEEK
jgi:hypothetical protein